VGPVVTKTEARVISGHFFFKPWSLLLVLRFP
jgi:uncharacterized protein YlaI